MTLAISAAHNDARLEGSRAFIDTGTGNGRLRFYGGTRPASGADPGTSPIVEITFAKPCGAVVGGVLVLSQLSTTGDQITASGAATWGRLVNGAGDWVADGDVTDAAGAGDFKLAGTTGTQLYAGGYVVLAATHLG